MTIQATDKNGDQVNTGTKVKLLFLLSGEWFDNLPDDEKNDLNSMVGEVFEVEEINEYGKPEIVKWWHEEHEDESRSMCHCLCVEPEQIEIVKEEE